MAFEKPTCEGVESCIIEFIGTLTNAELQSLRGVLAATLAIAQVLVNLITVQLEQLELLRTIYTVLLTPVTAAQDALLAGIGILPLSELPDCIGLGSLINDIRNIIRQFNPNVPFIEDFLNELDLKIDSFQSRLEELTDFSDLTQRLLACIDKFILFNDQVETQA